MVEFDVMKGSYSKLQLFERCERAFYFKYVKNMEYTTPAMEFGKIIHEELAKFLTTGVEGENVKQFLTQKVRRYAGVNPEYVELQLKFNSPSGTEYTAVIDLFENNTAKVLDWKTGWQKEADVRQLYIYAYALKKNGEKPEKLSFFYLRFDKEDEFTLSSDKLNETIDWMDRIEDSMNEKLFLYSVSEDEEEFERNYSSCRGCPYAKLCLGEDIANREKAIEIAMYIDELEAKLNAAREALKTYLEQTGEELVTDSGVWRLTPVNSFSFDTRKVWEYIKSLGKDPIEFANFTLTSLKKLKISEDILEQLGERNVTYQLRKTKK
ncbi:RecB family exonuclease [Caldicellulosiruptor morganii]|uniref:PD-(D/E)XK nuclease family protein n=1 Tax=Caldicellulosiruptor morganii TaxID=1387555 RepID=A0ABY7BL21_9FIRM|nr:PD-(D/E)XK nuclease family protein [Caldicellulosiruptor morganii]WAM33284.1 PD-(D/E)XK nuclease family protein [Caldicellulosiruptor morganii]